jgi:hypothetical protein
MRRRTLRGRRFVSTPSLRRRRPNYRNCRERSVAASFTARRRSLGVGGSLRCIRAVWQLDPHSGVAMSLRMPAVRIFPLWRNVTNHRRKRSARSPNCAVYANSATTAIPLDFIASTLQRIQVGTRQLLHFAEVACVKTKSRTKHFLFQIQMKMRRQAREHLEAGVIVKFANNPLAAI